MLPWLGAVLMAAPFWSQATESFPAPPPEALAADVIFLGEQHDNPGHHALQAEWVAALRPRAVVFEMLTTEQSGRITPDVLRDSDTLEQLLGWTASGWPDFDMYFPVFAAAPDAGIFGAAVPRERVRGLMRDDLHAVAPELTERFALDAPLPQAEQEQREALQKAAHCDALPDGMLPMMVSVQRLRDAALADAALRALESAGAPVVVITGNGHAREDWGAPFLLRKVAPDVAVFTLGQGEAGQAPQGGFGAVVDGPTVDRGDPCAAFR